MRLKVCELTRTAVWRRRRLLIVCSVVVVVLMASGISAAVAMTASLPDGTADHPAVADGAPGGAESIVATASQRHSAGVPGGQSPGRAGAAAETPDTTSQASGAIDPDGARSMESDASGAIAQASSQSDDVANASPGSSPMVASAGPPVWIDVSTTTTSTTPTTQPPTTSTSLSWADLRGVTTTTKIVREVSGYEVVVDRSSNKVSIAGNPEADVFVAGGIDVFAPQADGTKLMWMVLYEGAWPPDGPQPGKPGNGSWENENDGLVVGLAPRSGAASVAWETGFTDVFVRGADDALYHRRGRTDWSDWENLGGLLSSDPAVASRGPGQLDVFVRGPFAHLWHRSFDGLVWSKWEDLGGSLKSEPAAVSRDPGRIDVFARGDDDALWYLSYDGTGWLPWRSLGGTLTSGPAATCAPYSDRLDVFARGQGDTLWHMAGTLVERSYEWTPWEDLGGSPFASSPAAASWSQDRLDVYVRGTDFKTGADTALWHKWWDGSQWLP